MNTSLDKIVIGWLLHKPLVNSMALARKAFYVEPLPQGALPIYDRGEPAGTLWVSSKEEEEITRKLEGPAL